MLLYIIGFLISFFISLSLNRLSYFRFFNLRMDAKVVLVLTTLSWIGVLMQSLVIIYEIIIEKYKYNPKIDKIIKFIEGKD